MKIKDIKRLIEPDQQQMILVLKTLYDLDKSKSYNLIDIGGDKKQLKKFIPPNVKYYSLDYAGDHDYVFDLDRGKMPIKNRTFDIIVCTETIEHTIWPEKVMKELLRIAKKDAIFVLSMPNEYNFYLRLQYLFGIKNIFQETFKTTTEHLHIHSPRIKDITEFFSNYIKINEKYYGWHSMSSNERYKIKRIFVKPIDYIINKLAWIWPSLFSRFVVVAGTAK